MALPSNDHHVHSDGYYSEKGEPDQERMLMELADEIEQLPGVLDVWPDDGRIEVEVSEQDRDGSVESAVDEWDCTIVPADTGWIEIRPK